MTQHASFRQFDDSEIEQGVAHVKQDRTARKKKCVKHYKGCAVDPNLLRTIANDVGVRNFKDPNGPPLPALTGLVCREHLRQRNIREEQIYEGYLCAVMKMFAGRRAKKGNAQRTKKVAETPLRAQMQKYAELPSGQFLLPLHG